MSTILIFTGGEGVDASVVSDLPVPDLTIAADGGYEIATRLGQPVDVLVGDLDSLGTADLPDHVIIERHDRDKDQTDLDLALELALREDPERVIVVGGAGGRHDHELATSRLLTSERWSRIEEIDWLTGRSRVYVVRGHRMIHGDVGSTISLIAGPRGAVGVETRGLKWNLSDEELPAGSTRGVSNLMTSPVIDIRVRDGSLLAVLPEDQP